MVIEYNKLIEIKDKEQLLKDLSFEINNDKIVITNFTLQKN